MSPMRGRPLAIIVVTGLLVAACTEADAGDPAEADGTPSVAASSTTEAPLPPIELVTRSGPFQLTLDQVPDDLGPGTTLEAAAPDGRTLTVGQVAENGTLLLRDLPAGTVRLFVQDEGGERVAEAARQTVPGTEGPPAEFYRETTLQPGFNYITARDGTTLSAFVTLPGPADDGPYPTLVEYSGYSPSRPGGNDPNRLVLPTLGYALVQVNVRGTGCSGGSFDAFERIQSLDGYDVIETVATQPWSGKVGMYGVSYAGIMQLHVASSQPPSLAAIAPMSVLDEVGSVLYPGGIYNPGFGEAWAAQVSSRAVPFGQGWERERVEGGDEECGHNQILRVHNPDLVELVQNTPFTNALTKERSPSTIVGSITVPVFLAGAWQDEQTGGRWPALIDKFDNAPLVRVTMYNGLHIDAVAPRVLSAVTEFYDLYLEDSEPGAGTVVGLALAGGLAVVFGQALPIRFNRFDPTERESLRRAYEAEDPIRVLFELGATRSNLPVPSFEASFATWPPAAAIPTSFFVRGEGDGAVLSAVAPASVGSGSPIAEFTTDPAEGALTTTDDLSAIWTNNPSWSWPASTPETSIEVVTGPLVEDLAVVGPASADLWVTADATDGDVEVTVSEVHPDGSETYVQSGWLRLSRRALGPDSTELRPIPTGLEADVAPLTPGGEPVLARVEILPFAHVFRAGSRVALTIDTPGASRPQWTFDIGPEPVTIQLYSSSERPSRLVLPVLDDLRAPTPPPLCGSLRGQPCRP